MKRILFALLLLTISLGAQQQPPVAYQPQLISYPSTPFGSCQIYQAALNVSNGAYYLCNPATNTWVSSINPVTGPSTFNVKSYGAKGDTQVSAGNCTLASGSPNMSCTGVTFTTADIGKRANCGLASGGGTFFTVGSTIISLVNSTTVALSSNGGNTSAATCEWGTVDDTAINTAVTAWLAAIRGRSAQGPNLIGSVPLNPPTLYFPAGGYLYCGSGGNPMVSLAANLAGTAIIGDAPRESWLVACDNNTTIGGGGFFISQLSGSGGLVIKNLAFTSSYLPVSANPPALSLSGSHVTENLYVSSWNGGSGFTSSGTGYNLNLVVDTSGAGLLVGALDCNGCADEFHSGGSSNNANNENVSVRNALGLNAGTGPRFVGNFINDECGMQTNGCFRVQNSTDVWILGSALFGTPGGSALNVDGTSFVHLEGGIVGVFGNDTNTSGLVIQAGGVVQSSDVRYVGTGTGKCITSTGTFNDNGGNTCESQFPIASGTSTGTAAVLTVTTVGANASANCSVGDALEVQGAAIAGYNGYYPAGTTTGITAVTATTISYTTAGSNLGALPAGGTAYCRNIQTYSGTLPRALLNNPIPNTCYYTITPIANATTVTLCNFKLGSATNITAIKASSQATTTCATPPLITISDGTVSQTLTLTSGKSSWDSSVDTSTGVGTTIFKPNGTITVKYDVAANSACATPATNLSVSYNISPILSN